MGGTKKRRGAVVSASVLAATGLAAAVFAGPAEAASASCEDGHEVQPVSFAPDKHRGVIECDWVGRDSLVRVRLDMKLPASDSTSVWFNTRYKPYRTLWRQGFFNDVRQEVRED